MASSDRAVRTAPRHRSRRAIAAALAALVLLVAALPASAYWPVASRSSYVSQFSGRGHVAIDIAARYGTAIVPIRTGRTVFAGWRRNCGGRQVYVSHGNGLYSAYYHLSRLSTFRGQTVSGGRETIGFVGTSGCASGPHLHVEVWRGYPWRSGSYRVNPWRFIDEGKYLPYRYR